MGISFCLVLYCIFSVIIIDCNGADVLTLGMSISGNQVMVSAGGMFALGFFSPGNSTNRYVGLWYNKISEQTVVWVANREIPITKDSGGVVRLSNDGNLVISDGRENVIWSSNVSVSDVARENLSAVLMNSGNLVLKSRSNETVLWQSFDNPTDTLIPGMKIGINLRTGHYHSLTSWKDDEDPESGLFSFSLDHRGPLQLVLRKNSEVYTRSDVWEGNSFISQFFNSIDVFRFPININEAEIYVTFSLFQDSITVRMFLSRTGDLLCFSWDENSKKWNQIWSAQGYKCGFYGLCGAFGICDENNPGAPCNCFPGFRPLSQKDWDMRNWSGGCIRRKELKCDKRNGLLRLERVKMPDNSIMFTDLSVKDCEIKCHTNCSCTAYAYANASIGYTSVCLNWAGNLVDVVQLHDSGPEMDLYVRVDNFELGNRSFMPSKGRKTSFFNPANWHLWIVLTLCTMLILVGSSAIYCRWMKNVKQKDTAVGMDLLSFDLAIDNKYRGRTNEDNEVDELCCDEKDVILPFFTFASVVAATDNFSVANKLGSGGFGPVYKGQLLRGQEVAVKRLSRMSGQGYEEFKNEITLIAKLQHSNLVRLLGCCVESGEKILIYEYLPNKSLDSFLFDASKSGLLNWERHIRIVEGIAQGLLYLHQHSRVRIIHRDLKASNILLDGDMEPKISDFGIARIFGGNNGSAANTKRIVGTYGYMSPEYAIRGVFSTKSDVYSFGVLLLEILSGKKNTILDISKYSCTLPGYAWELWRSGGGMEFLDQNLGNSQLFQILIRYIHAALLCVEENAADRPNMSDVLSMIRNELMTLPSPKQVAFLFAQIPDDASSSASVEHGASVNDLTNSIVEAR